MRRGRNTNNVGLGNVVCCQIFKNDAAFMRLLVNLKLPAGHTAYFH